MSDSTAPTNQTPQSDSTENLGEGGAKALQAEREARKQAQTQAKQATEQLAALTAQFEEAKTEWEKTQTQTQTQLADLNRDKTRWQVAFEKNLPADLIDFLTGNNMEEMSEQADRLTTHLSHTTTPEPLRPDMTQGAGNTSPNLTPLQAFTNKLEALENHKH